MVRDFVLISAFTLKRTSAYISMLTKSILDAAVAIPQSEAILFILHGASGRSRLGARGPFLSAAEWVSFMELSRCSEQIQSGSLR